MTQTIDLSVAYYLEASFDGTMKELDLPEMSIRCDTNEPDDRRWTLYWYGVKERKPQYVRAATVGEAVAKAREVLES